MDNVSRISISLEPELLERFDASISKKGYATRSEAIRDLVRDSLAENEWKHSEEVMTGTLITVYDESAKDILNKLSIVMNRHRNLILTRTTVSLSDRNRMMVTIVDGRLCELKGLAEDITSVKGVLRGKITMVSPNTCNMHHIGLRE